MSDDEFMAAGLRGFSFDTRVARRPQRTHLRLVRSNGVVPMTRTQKDLERPRKNQEGSIMRIIERIIHTAGRFAVGFGIGLALVSTFVVVTTVPALDPAKAPKPVGVVHLDPVTVAISADRFRAIQEELRAEPALVQTRGEKPLDG